MVSTFWMLMPRLKALMPLCLACSGQTRQGSKHEEKLITLASGIWTRTEREYSASRRMLLAVLKSIEHFHHYLLGKSFVIRCDDDDGLSWTMTFREETNQIEVLVDFDENFKCGEGCSKED